MAFILNPRKFKSMARPGRRRLSTSNVKYKRYRFQLFKARKRIFHKMLPFIANLFKYKKKNNNQFFRFKKRL